MADIIPTATTLISLFIHSKKLTGRGITGTGSTEPGDPERTRARPRTGRGWMEPSNPRPDPSKDRLLMRRKPQRERARHTHRREFLCCAREEGRLWRLARKVRTFDRGDGEARCRWQHLPSTFWIWGEMCSLTVCIGTMSGTAHHFPLPCFEFCDVCWVWSVVWMCAGIGFSFVGLIGTWCHLGWAFWVDVPMGFWRWKEGEWGMGWIF